MTLVRKRSFDFSQNTAGVDVVEIAVDACDVTCFGDAVLAVRVHSNEISNGDSTIFVEAYNTAPSEDDPEMTFAEAEPAASVTVIRADQMEAGTLLLSGLAAGFGPALQIRVTGHRIATATVRAELSIELVARTGVTAPRRSLADTLVVGNRSSGTDIIVSSTDVVRGEDGASPTGMVVRGGDASTGNTGGGEATLRGGNAAGTSRGGIAQLAGGTGGSNGFGGDVEILGGTAGASGGDGGDVVIVAGEAASGDGGSISLASGTGSTDDGDIGLTTPSTAGAIRFRTQQAGFAGTTWDQLTFATQQTLAPAATYDIVLATLSTNGRNVKLEAYITAQEDGVANSIRSGRVIYTAYRSGGTVALLTFHLASTQGAGNLNTDPLNFQIVVSGDDLVMRTTNASGGNTRTVNLAMWWSRQEGGFAS
jgi:hypothetical protein